MFSKSRSDCAKEHNTLRRIIFISPPGEVQSTVISVYGCLYVCMSVYIHCICFLHISITTRPNVTEFYVHMLPVSGRGSILFWQQSSTSCTSGFVDDVMFSRMGPIGQNQSDDVMFGRVRQTTTRGRSLLSPIVLLYYNNDCALNKKQTLAKIAVLWKHLVSLP